MRTTNIRHKTRQNFEHVSDTRVDMWDRLALWTITTAGGLAAGTGALGFAWYCVHGAVTKPKLYVKEGPLRDAVLPHCPSLLKPYRPTPWALNTHLQTMVGLMRRVSISGHYRRQIFLASDGATLGLDWFDKCDDLSWAAVTVPIVLVVHGVNGGSHEGYCKWACAAACSKGWRSCVLNFRGCNGLPFTSPRGYTATLTDDLYRAVESIKGRFPKAPLFAVGYSLGGMILTKYVADADSGYFDTGSIKGSGLVAAAMVSNPVCLNNSCRNISNPWTLNYMYNVAVAYKLKEFIATHTEAYTQIGGVAMDLDAVLKSWTVQAVEEEGLPKTFGYPTREHYYQEAASLQYIPLITTPSLLLMSTDDPFLGVIPDKECSDNPNTLLAITSYGGHVAFTKGLWPFQISWMDEVVMEYFQQSLLHHPSSAWAVDANGKADALHVWDRHSIPRKHTKQTPSDSDRRNLTGGQSDRRLVSLLSKL